MFYPADPAILNSSIQLLLDSAPAVSSTGTIVAMVSPHAGYQFSGVTASAAYRLLGSQRIDTVVIVSPSHKEYFPGISVYDGKAYRTPLGDMEIDAELREELTSGPSIIEASGRGHGSEHGVEVHLPFIQKLFGNVKILPIVMGVQNRYYCFELGNRLGSLLAGKTALLVASTDLSHYHPYQEAIALDNIVVGHIASFHYEELMNDLESEIVEACGGGPTVAVLRAAKQLGASKVTVLHQCNSGDVTGDKRAVVGYVSALALRTN